MFGSTSRTAAAAVVAVGAVVSVAVSAVAATPVTYRVIAGTTKTGSAAFTGKTANGTMASPTLTLTDNRTSTPVGCTSASLHGAITLGGAVAAARFAKVTKSTYAGCTAFGGYVTLKPKQVGTWYLNGSGKTVNGVTKVFLGNVKAAITSPTCSLTLAGAADGTYTNSSKKLAVQPRAGSGHALKASHVTGCGGVIANGDRMTLVGVFKVSTPKGSLRIS